MTDRNNRYFAGALAFAFIIAWATVGAFVAVLATVACGAIAFAPRLRRSGARRPKARPRRTVAHELVPDDPSLILTISQ